MHIAMWTCARSRSTLLLRAFQQHRRCLALDEPLYAPYLVSAGFDHPHRQEILDHHETDYDRVIQEMTGLLPPNIDFSFQKHTANNLRKTDKLTWLSTLKSFFLIRSPKEIILSRHDIYDGDRNFTLHEIGLRDLYQLFLKVQEITHTIPVVLDSTDLIKSPRTMLPRLCSRLGIEFSDSMMTWSPGLKESDPIWAKSWYRTLLNSSGFIPYKPATRPLPAHLVSLHEECLPFYEALSEHCI